MLTLLAALVPLLADMPSSDGNSMYSFKELAQVVAAFVAGTAVVVWTVSALLHSQREKAAERNSGSLEKALENANEQLRYKQNELSLKHQEIVQKTHECEQAQKRIANLQSQQEPRDGELTQVEQQLSEVRQQLTTWLAKSAATEDNLATKEQELKKVRGQLDEAQQLIGGLNGQLGGLQVSLDAYEDELAGLRNRLRNATRKDGMIWTEKVKYNAPEFKPLAEDGRRTPILSVLNLKGGVGKTTITANLGAALSSAGYRVLLIDLDLQGSLTGLWLDTDEQERIHKDGKLLGEFLAHSFDAEYPNLNDYCHPLLGGKSGIVPTTDALVYAELNLTIRWLLREGNKDPRFLLRKELHLRRITNSYDIVLLDCPPLINVSCINALAASDYLLIPVMPSQQTTIRVPPLLQRLRTFREQMIPELRVLGIIANRTHGSALTRAEETCLSLLDRTAADAWGAPIARLETIIPQSREVREAEDDSRALNPGDVLFDAFRRLSEEVVAALPSFCRQASRLTTPASEGVS